MRFLIAAGLLLSLTSIGLSQGEPERPTRRASNASVAQEKLTQADLDRTVARVEKMMRDLVPGVKFGPKLGRRKASQEVSREDVVAEFHRLFTAARPHFRFRPRPATTAPNKVTLNEKGARQQLNELVRWGFVSRQGNIASGKLPGLTLGQFGDALGFFLSRFGELTHIPSSRWSPYLQRPDA